MSKSNFSQNKVSDGVAYSMEEIRFPKVAKKNKELEKLILKEFECPVCLSYVTPPIMQCPSSHIICSDCYDHCNVCPTCRMPKGIGRAFMLENIHPLLSFPCKYDGCSFKAMGMWTKMHEKSCGFFPLTCPFRKSSCSWNGALSEIKHHFTDMHSENVFFESRQRLACHGFARYNIDRSYTIIFNVFENIFQLSWEFNRIRQVAKFKMDQIGMRTNHEKYQYTISFAPRFPILQRHRRKIVITAEVARHYEMARTPLSADFALYFADLNILCNRFNGNLYYEVCIERNDEIENFGVRLRHWLNF